MMMKKLILVMILVITTFVLLPGCTTGSGSVLIGTENNSNTRFSMTYEKFTGYRQKTLSVGEDPVEVVVSVTTSGGLLDASIKNNDTGEYSYQGQDLQTTSFTVTLTDPGEYTLRVDAKKHSGSYVFSWNK